MRTTKRHYDTRDVYGRKRINEWFDDKQRPTGMNQRGKDFFLELKDVEKHYSRNAVIVFFLISRYGVRDLYEMQASIRRVKGLIAKTRIELKGIKDVEGNVIAEPHAVTKEWEPVFRRTIDSLRRRAEYNFLIIKKDLEETKVYPYFEAVGFDRLIDFSVKYAGKEDEQADQLEEEINEWNACHQEEITAHMEKMAEQIRNRDAHRQKVKETNKAERDARRAAKKEADAEVREIRKNQQAYRRRQKMIDRSFERYYT